MFDERELASSFDADSRASTAAIRVAHQSAQSESEEEKLQRYQVQLAQLKQMTKAQLSR